MQRLDCCAMQLGCIDFIAMTTAIAAVAGIGPKKQLHPTRPDPQICVPSKLGVMAVGYLYGYFAQAAVISILATRVWYRGSDGTSDYVRPLPASYHCKDCKHASCKHKQ